MAGCTWRDIKAKLHTSWAGRNKRFREKAGMLIADSAEITRPTWISETIVVKIQTLAHASHDVMR